MIFANCRGMICRNLNEKKGGNRATATLLDNLPINFYC